MGREGAGKTMKHLMSFTGYLNVVFTSDTRAFKFPEKQNNIKTTVGFSPYQAVLFVRCSSWKNSIKMGCLQSRKVEENYLLQSLHEHETGINCMAVSEDGSVLATGGEDKTARIWSTKVSLREG
ncbi:hypothetical protein RRG08_017701 [Elysia crispata]|uniref:Uncharacterized protein n=1 Tax=Elysia crispata TaxID=231223 RepID=A0AAE1DRJ8_9GAST|nr:hypothetical protein RRG08_017701 [Elysia crispata]